MAHLSIDLLGPLQVSVSSSPIVGLESVKVRALLAYLAVEADRPHTRTALAGLLWPDYPEDSARHNLRQALFNLRLMLGDHATEPPYLLVTHDTIQLNRESDCSVDVDLFNHLFLTCQENLPRCAEDCSIHASNLEQMIRLYRGEFLEQLSVDDSEEFEEWMLVQRESYHQRILEAHNYLTNYYELRADYTAARQHASRQLDLDPWREEAHRQLMRLLALDGQRSAALAQYETCKKILADELDVEPAAETRELYEQIRQGDLALNIQHPTRIASIPLNNLPIQQAPFIGRELELRQLGDRIKDPECKCISLIGPGGIGKTRLALQVAGEHLRGFAQGVAFVSLASAGSSDDIVPAIAKAVNFSMSSPGDPQADLINYLREKQMLLILDNIEHLLFDDAGHEGIVLIVQEIIASAPGVKLLVTTREVLNLQSECIFEVRGLAFPETTQTDGFDELDAVKLFVQRARRAFPKFLIDAENRTDIAHICRLVEGMPLAIEIAATWMRILSPKEITAEIEKSLDFLSTSVRDLPERHRSMRAVWDHSWQMLSTIEQQVLSKLSVFRGGFQRQAGDQVAGATLSILSTLVNRSMLRRTAAGRYDLHELVRQYSAEKLALNPQIESDTLSRHYDFYLNLAEIANQELQGPNQLDWMSRLEQDHDNIRVALEWALGGEKCHFTSDESALRLAAALRWFWRMRGHFHEGCNWLMKAIECSPDRKSLARARALLGLSLLRNGLGDLALALPPAEESVAISRELGEDRCLAEALMIEGLTLLWQGQATLGHARTREALSIFRKLGDRWGEAQALYRLGSYLADYSGDPAGREMLEESANILDGMHEKYLNTSVLISLGIVDLSLGNYASALSSFLNGLEAAREIKHPWGIADALTNLGCLFRIQGDYSKAQSHFDEAVRVYQEQGRNIWEADVLCAMAENGMAQGDFPAAHLHLQAVYNLLGSSENAWLQMLVIYFRGLLAYYEGELEKALDLLAEATQRAQNGQFKPDLARSLVSLGRVRLQLGEAEQANELIRQGLALFMRFGHKLGIVNALEALASVCVTNEEYMQAVVLFATANNLRNSMSAPLPPIEHDAYEACVVKSRVAMGEALFTQAWDGAVSRSYEDVVDNYVGSKSEGWSIYQV